MVPHNLWSFADKSVILNDSYWPSRWSISGPDGFKRAWGRSRPRVATLLKLLIVIIGVATALRAWGNTLIIVTLQKSLDIKWGGTTREEFSAGDTLIVVRNYPWYHWYPWGPLSAESG
jgi:hypothetical protein